MAHPRLFWWWRQVNWVSILCVLIQNILIVKNKLSCKFVEFLYQSKMVYNSASTLYTQMGHLCGHTTIINKPALSFLAWTSDVTLRSSWIMLRWAHVLVSFDLAFISHGLTSVLQRSDFHQMSGVWCLGIFRLILGFSQKWAFKFVLRGTKSTWFPCM